jgi:hypothetical protein
MRVDINSIRYCSYDTDESRVFSSPANDCPVLAIFEAVDEHDLKSLNLILAARRSKRGGGSPEPRELQNLRRK